MMEESSVVSGLVGQKVDSWGYIPRLNRIPNCIHHICRTRISVARAWDSKKLDFSRFLLYIFTVYLVWILMGFSFSLSSLNLFSDAVYDSWVDRLKQCFVNLIEISGDSKPMCRLRNEKF